MRKVITKQVINKNINLISCKLNTIVRNSLPYVIPLQYKNNQVISCSVIKSVH